MEPSGNMKAKPLQTNAGQLWYLQQGSQVGGVSVRPALSSTSPSDQSCCFPSFLKCWSLILIFHPKSYLSSCVWKILPVTMYVSKYFFRKLKKFTTLRDKMYRTYKELWQLNSKDNLTLKTDKWYEYTFLQRRETNDQKAPPPPPTKRYA